jgi:hypothetical protein
MKPNCLAYALGVLIVVGTSCELTRESRSKAVSYPTPGITYDISGGPPRLSTNEVLKIAYSCAAAHRIDTQRFRCRSVRYPATAPGTILTNKWILYFAPDMVPLHEDFFIRIDDQSGTPEFIHR